VRPPIVSHLPEHLSFFWISSVKVVARSAQGRGILQGVITPFCLGDQVMNLNEWRVAHTTSKRRLLLGQGADAFTEGHVRIPRLTLILRTQVNYRLIAAHHDKHPRAIPAGNLGNAQRPASSAGG